MSLDLDRLKSEANLLDLIGNDTYLKKVTAGGEYAGPCPFCGGRDRFHATRDWWFCRRCTNERRQDVIAYVMQRENADFKEAVSILGGGRLSDSFKPVTSQVKAVKMQSEDWQQAAVQVVTACEAALWAETPKSIQVRRWLNKRGLNDDTLKAWRIGFNPEDRKIGGLRVKSGVTIPYFGDQRLYAINVRRLPSTLKADPKLDKYQLVIGSKRVLFGTEYMMRKPDVVIVEGEFDAMLVWQEVRGLVDVMTMGAAKAMPDELWLIHLAAGQRFHVLTDNDPAGEAAAASWMGLVKAKGTRQHVPAGKDITEYWQQRGNVHSFIASLLPRIEPEPTVTGLLLVKGKHATQSNEAIAAAFCEVLPTLQVTEWPSDAGKRARLWALLTDARWAEQQAATDTLMALCGRGDDVTDDEWEQAGDRCAAAKVAFGAMIAADERLGATAEVSTMHSRPKITSATEHQQGLL